ncbi:hypothetical protein [Hymenobacter yonginensis]|uniref:Uncharacterized protein n=1 Tax=Hymenobacter yonginensis TaxID=748197 RepID=A0ABY7PV18_9BACT|nr:hypothetical protein [Hymenobacter yonginensis]WBO86755.1 hypothetical protein O9Z63_20960 [Hymenobacter yonginensis]
MWVTLRNIMLAALRYDTGRQQSEANSHTLVAHLQLLALDESILGHLSGTPAHAAFVAADDEAQRHLLFSNSYLQDVDGVKSGIVATEGLNTLLKQQAVAVAADTQAAELFWQKCNVLRVLHEQPALPPGLKLALQDILPALDKRQDARIWLRYYAWRKVQYLNRLEEVWLLEDPAFNERALNEQLLQNSDLGLLDLTPFLRLVVRADAPFKPGNTTADEYTAYQKQLQVVSDQLRKEAANITTSSDKTARAGYEKKYQELSQQQAAYAYLLDQKKKELSTLQSWKQSALDFVKENRADTGFVLKETGKALWASAGVTLAEAAVNWYKGKPVDQKLGEKVLAGVAIAAGTALVSYFLGPLGPMAAGLAQNHFFPQPDPLQAGFTALNNKIDAGFARIEAQLAKLQTEVQAGFAKVDARLSKLSDFVVGSTSLQLELQSFKNNIGAADAVLDSIEGEYSALFEQKNHVVLEHKLLEWHQAFGAQLGALVKQFYHRDYDLSRAQLGKTTPAGALPTIVELLITFYQRPDPFYQPFHLTCQDILALANRLRLLVLRYNVVRKKLQDTLSATVVFLASPDKQLLLNKLRDLHLGEADERAAHFAGVLLLDRLVLGPRNHTLYHNLLDYLHEPAKFNMTKGFGLLAPTAAGQQWIPAAGPKGERATWLKLAAVAQNSPARYYLMPCVSPRVATSQGAPDFELLTFYRSSEVPDRLPVNLALGLRDELVFFRPSFEDRLAAQAPPLADAVFANSVEQLLLGQTRLDVRQLDNHRIRLSLPRRENMLEFESYTPIDRSGSPTGPAQYSLRVLMPSGSLSLPMSAEQPNASLHHVLPLLTPDEAGLEIAFEHLLPSGRSELVRSTTSLVGYHDFANDPHHFSKRIGWTTHQALGTYRPAQPGAASTGTTHRAFCHVLAPDEQLESLRSANGRYWLQLEPLPGQREPILQYFDNGQPMGCVFDYYHFKDGNHQVHAELQADGNFVLIDSKGHIVAATHTSGQANCSLHLGDDGQLRLLNPQGFTVHTFARHALRLSRDEKTSYWHSGLKKQFQELVSPDGAYRVKLDFFRGRTERAGYWREVAHPIHGNTTVFDVCELGLRLIRYHDQNGSHEVTFYQRMVPPVTHADDDASSNEARHYWDKCSDDWVNRLKEDVESKEIRVYLDFRANGEVVGLIGSKQIVTFFTYYGLKTVTTLNRPDATLSQGVFLDLSNDGGLRLRDAATSKVLRELMAPPKA